MVNWSPVCGTRGRR